jgi:hypothetical protein
MNEAVMNPPRKKSVEDSGITAMHEELKTLFTSGIGKVNERLDTYNTTQTQIATKLEIYEQKQKKHSEDIDLLKLNDAGCPARTGWVGINREVGELNRFKQDVDRSGVFGPKQEATGVTDVSSARAWTEANRDVGFFAMIKKLGPIIFGVAIGAAIVGYLVAMAAGKVSM